MTRGVWRVQWQKSYKQPWTPYIGRGRGTSSNRAAPAAPYRGGAPATSVPATRCDRTHSADRRHAKRSRSKSRDRSHSPPRERKSRRPNGPRRSRSRSPPSVWAGPSDRYYRSLYLQSPLSSPSTPAFPYNTYGYFPAHNTAAAPAPHTYPTYTSNHGHSLLPCPGNWQSVALVPYPSPTNTPHT